MKLHIGMIGAGAISHAHLKGWMNHENVGQITVADTHPAARQLVQQNLGLPTVADYRELLELPEIDVVDICLPHYLHHGVALEAFDAGKTVLLEKPISMTVAEADEMMAAAEQAGKRLYVSHNMRFMPAHQEAKRLMDEGTIGKPFLAVFNVIGNEFHRMNDPESWKGSWEYAGGGALIDTGMHAIYVIQHFFGAASAVTAVARRILVQPEHKAEDNVLVALEFGEEVLGNLALTYTALAHPWQEERHIYGTEGSLHVRDNPTQTLTLVQGQEHQAIPLPSPGDLDPHQFSIVRSIHHFVDAYLQDVPFETTPEEGRSALRTILAAYRSSEEGCRIDLGG